MRMDIKKRTSHFIISLLVTVVVVRIFLYFFPNINLTLGSYNIHHLFTGTVLLIIAFILILHNIINNYTIILAGIATGFITDELVYLLGTNGSDLAYSSSVSFWGMVIVTGIVIIITQSVYYYRKKRGK
tara:strand:+ start:151 stop:537 length:387 start_codon:yes stop_codon:yes gene_type:complete